MAGRAASPCHAPQLAFHNGVVQEEDQEAERPRMPAGFVRGKAADRWERSWCAELHDSIQLVAERAMREKWSTRNCILHPPPQLLMIPYVPNVLDVKRPAATFTRRLPRLSQRSTLIFSSTRCADREDDGAGKKLRHDPVTLCLLAMLLCIAKALCWASHLTYAG